jgi:hypothetical protein
MIPRGNRAGSRLALGVTIAVVVAFGFSPAKAQGPAAGPPSPANGPANDVARVEDGKGGDMGRLPAADVPRLEEGKDAPKTPLPTSVAPKDVRLVNSKHIRLNFDVKDVGPSGVSTVELWYTRDGKDWRKGSELNNAKSPITFRVADEGVYGFTLIVHSGVGLAKAPPKTGDAPQVWIEVDQTPPVLTMYEPKVGKHREITFSWEASDKNLDAHPISFFYAEKAEGPWKPIAEHLENTGKLAWPMPAGMPYRFFLRAQAIDRAGNLAVAQTEAPVTIDPSEPEAVILGVDGITDKPR